MTVNVTKRPTSSSPRRREHWGKRSCSSCRGRFPKKELLFLLHEEGRFRCVERDGALGKGSYVCYDAGCLKRFFRRMRLEDQLLETLELCLDRLEARAAVLKRHSQAEARFNCVECAARKLREVRATLMIERVEGTKGQEEWRRP